jgi:TAG lipase/steryl ester hydrolase/phospholipase A2/LPA acyltransferase
MVHIGVLKSLKEADLLPRIISGASAGSIVASVVCTTTDDELPALIDNFAYGDLAVFDDESNPESVFQRVARFLKIGAWVDIEHLIRVMKSLLGDMTFQEAYYRTRRVLNICVSSARYWRADSQFMIVEANVRQHL